MKTKTRKIKSRFGYLAYLILFFGTLSLVSCKDPNLYSEEETRGCTDPQAANYDPLAVLNDGSCIKTDNSQNSVFVKYTATWCGPCGSYGMPLFQSKITQHSGKVLSMSLQYNDAISTSESSALVDQFLQHMPPPNGLSTPSFGVNDQYYSQNTALFDAEITNKSQQSPNIGLGINWTRGSGKNAGKINMNILGKWLKVTNGEWKITVFVIAKKIIGPQKIDDTYDSQFEHKHVLLGAITSGGIYGEPFYQGTTEVGQLTWWKSVVELDSSWNIENLNFGIVVWRKQSGKWIFENCTIN